MTHHAPHARAAGRIDNLSAGFVSDLDGFIRQHRPDAWFFGHTHRWLETEVGGTMIRNVSLGYPSELQSDKETEVLLRGLIGHGGPC